MARIPGGITSRPSGKLGNIIFGAARTPEGKVATAREAVQPSNPNTPDQQQQRSKFRQALNIVQGIGPGVYQDDWNRSVGQLPGFQSLQSIMLNNIDQNDALEVPPDRQLGDLHTPDSITGGSQSQPDRIDISYSTDVGSNGDPNDAAVLIAIEQSEPANRKRDVQAPGNLGTRQNGEASISVNQADTTYVVGVYFRGKDTAEGLLSTAEFVTATTAT